MSVKRGQQTRAANPNWRGGRSITPAGYVLIRNPEHPRADVRGYVYEHIIVMEAVLGRPLAPGERVRHRDGRPDGNDPANLILVPPLDRAAMTSCACGCGTSMTRLDATGRLRRFVSGHNTPRGCREGARPRHETGSGLSEAEKEARLDDFDGECAYGCGRRATAWDHLIPWSKGGSFRQAGNAVPACRACNQSKSDSNDVWSWIERGMRSRHVDAWMSLVDLALYWGALDVDQYPTAAIEAVA